MVGYPLIISNLQQRLLSILPLQPWKRFPYVDIKARTKESVCHNFSWCFLRITFRGQFTFYFSAQHNLTWISLFADRTQNVDRIIVCHIPGEEYVMLHCSGSISLVHLPKFSQQTLVLLAVLWVLCLSKVQTELCLFPKEKHSIPDKMFKFILGRGQAIKHGEGQTGKCILLPSPQQPTGPPFPTPETNCFNIPVNVVVQ